MELTKDEFESSSSFISKEQTIVIKNILLDKNKNSRTKNKEIKKLFSSNDILEPYIDFFTTLVTGGKFQLKKLNLDSPIEGEIQLSNPSFEEMEGTLKDDFKLVMIAKQIYDFVSLHDILHDKEFLSDAMVDFYDIHQKDLKKLKNIIISIDKNKGFKDEKERLYYKIFKCKETINYSAFVHKNSNVQRPPIEKFNTEIAKILSENQSFVPANKENDFQDLLKKAKDKELLKTISIQSTSVIPHQLHLNELRIILTNAQKYFPFLNNISEKLELLFTFKVPYYYGPLNDKSPYSNVKRTQYATVTPWNFKDIIDENQTREKFMKKLTNTCFHLMGETVMPKKALAYEDFLIYNRLNTLMVNGNYLSTQDKKQFYEYIISRPKTTLEQLKKEIAKRENMNLLDITFSHIQENIPFEASSHAALMKFFDVEKEQKKLEKLITLATIYADDKKSFKILLEKEKNLTEEQRKVLLNLPTKKWAPFSYKLLNDIYYQDDAGVIFSILDIMRLENKDFQMVLNDEQYHFKDLILQENAQIMQNKTPQDLIDEKLETVPSNVQRSIRQTLLVIDDIIKAANNKMPQKIFIEVTRSNDDSKKGKESISREKELTQFIDELFKDPEINQFPNMDLDKLQKELQELDKIKLKGKHLYLYFKQLGIDLYTGLPIDINEVLDSTKYDLDHIIPQSLLKDDSLDNLVLVNRKINQKEKGNQYPLSAEIRSKNKNLWKYLLKKKAISDKKYDHLTRSSEIKLNEIEDFVSRQINIVNYSNIVIRDILNIKYPDIKVIFSKSQYPSFIRKHLNIVKNRDVNDAHHAVDAYLNIVSGNILSTTFSKKYIIETFNKIKFDDKRTFNMESILENYFKKEQNVNKIKTNCFRRDALVTYKLDYYSKNGAFYEQTRSPKSKNLIPITFKPDNALKDTSKYGGYSDITQAYLLAVSYQEGKKFKKALLRVPYLYTIMYKNNSDELLKKIINNPKAENVKILRKIHLNQKIKLNNGIYLIYTNSENKNKYKMAYQNYIDNKFLLYLHQANKHFNDISEHLNEQTFIINSKNDEFLISKEKNREFFTYLLNKTKNKVYNTCNYIVKARETNIEVFEKLNLKEQIDVLNQWIKMMSRDCEKVTLNKKFNNLIECKLILTKNINPNNTITIIYESPTGLFKHEVKI